MEEKERTAQRLAAKAFWLIEQVYQMEAMFDDEDGTIADALSEAEEALSDFRRAR